MPAAIVFTGYFFFLLFVTHLIIKRKIPDFSFWQTGAVFSFKVLLGCLYGYIFLKYYHGDDTWSFFNESKLEFQKLFHQPGAFFSDLLPYHSFERTKDVGQGFALYIKTLEYGLMTKLLAIFNIFSGKNYYIDVLLFDFTVCWGPFLFFKMMVSFFPDKKRILFPVIFFIPTITFWLSGIRGDGILFLCIALILYYTNKSFDQNKISHWIYILAGFAGFLVFRAQYLLVFFPAFFCWLITNKNKRSAIRQWVLIYAACLCVFFVSMSFSPDNTFSGAFIKRQREFFALHGNTRFNLDSLKPTFGSFIKILPQATINTFARPFIWEAKGALQWMAALEIIAGWILLVFLLIAAQINWKQLFNHPLLLLFLFYGLSQIILIGYIVPFPGAIVRYKAIPELFLVVFLAVEIEWRKFNINYNNK